MHVAVALAQVIDLASTSAQYMPSAEMRGAPGSVQVSSYDVAANVPVALAKKTFFVPGAQYHVDAVSFADTAPDFIALRAFQAVEGSALIVQPLRPDWTIAARASAGLAGDFFGVDAGMLRASALATVTHSFSETFTLGGGALTSFSFGTFLPLPAVYMSWKPFDRAELEAFLPAFVHARYTIARRVRLGLRADLSGNEYAVRDPRIRDRWPCTARATDDPNTPADERIARPAECFDNLAYSVGSAGLAAGVRLFSSVWLDGFFGHSFFRRLDRRSASHDLLPEGRDEIPNTIVVRAGIVWRVPEGD